MADVSGRLWQRYDRQIRFAGLGLQGQRALGERRVLIVGVGGLGSWAAELLARAGVGMLRLADGDVVELVNIHRQALYEQADADAAAPKVHAAARRLRQINPDVEVQPVQARLDRHNVARLADGVDLILDGTDNFDTRFVINDYAVKANRPWVFAGVVGAEGQTMPVLPGTTACLRCIYESPPPPCTEPTCQRQGVVGPAVAAIAAIQACEAIKILSGRLQEVSRHLLKLDFWNNTVQRIDASRQADDCPCCKGGRFDYLEP